MRDDRWIVVPNWERFQHYGDRSPAWIKVYTELNSSDEWLSLTTAERGVLVTIWVEYARSHGGLRVEKVRALCGGSARAQHLESLNHAGFIELSASKPSRVRSRDKNRKEEIRKSRGDEPANFAIPDNLLKDVAPDDVTKFASRLKDGDKGTELVLRKLRRTLPFAAYENAWEALEHRRKQPPPLHSETRYYVATLKALAKEAIYL